jgi:restriction endonuclease Mrr
LDKLGLEKVYVQAKRWQQVVGRRKCRHSTVR